MKKIIALTSVFIAALFLATPAKAQLKLITLQGKLIDRSRNLPLQGTFSMIFKLYDSPTLGNELWSEAQTVTTNSEGIFSVLLGGVNPLNLDFNQQYYLEITIEGETLAPRYTLGSAPYVMQDKWVDEAGDTMRGKLTIDLTSSSGASGRDALEIKASNDNSEGVILVNKDSLTLWSTLLNNRANLKANSIDALGDVSSGGSVTASNDVKGSRVCIGNDCRSSWPAGDITGVYAGTGLSGGGSSGDVTLSLDTSYTDDRYVNEAGDTMSGNLRVKGDLKVDSNLKVSGDITGFDVIKTFHKSGMINLTSFSSGGVSIRIPSQYKGKLAIVTSRVWLCWHDCEYEAPDSVQEAIIRTLYKWYGWDDSCAEATPIKEWVSSVDNFWFPTVAHTLICPIKSDDVLGKDKVGLSIANYDPQAQSYEYDLKVFIVA